MAQRFFEEQWLDRFTRQNIEAVHAQVAAEVTCKLDVEYHINPQITLPNGGDFNFDILAGMGSSSAGSRSSQVATSGTLASIPNLRARLGSTLNIPSWCPQICLMIAATPCHRFS